MAGILRASMKIVAMHDRKAYSLGVRAANSEWVTAIAQYSPWLTISGHDHVTPRKSKRWHHRIGLTVCINAGQSDTGPLHYCVIEAEFAKTAPSLVVRMQVRAWPYSETLSLPS